MKKRNPVVTDAYNRGYEDGLEFAPKSPYYKEMEVYVAYEAGYEDGCWEAEKRDMEI